MDDIPGRQVTQPGAIDPVGPELHMPFTRRADLAIVSYTVKECLMNRSRIAMLRIVASLTLLAGGTAFAHPAADAATCLGQSVTIAGHGVITGTVGNDVILGSAGPDTITGKGGNDVICGSYGNDRITTGAGNARIDGGAGSDIIVLGPGLNIARGNTGNDDITGSDYATGTGNHGYHDRLSGGDGDDRIRGMGGN